MDDPNYAVIGWNDQKSANHNASLTEIQKDKIGELPNHCWNSIDKQSVVCDIVT
jgi:hypothetical protein